MSTMLQISAIALSTVFVLGAIAFTLVPIFPGTLLMIPAVLGYGLLINFHPFSTSFYIGEGVLMLIIFLVDNIAQMFGLKKMGGSKAGIWGGTIGMFVIPLLISPLGLIAIIFGPLIGAVVGAMVGEMLVRRTGKEVLKVGLGAALSFMGGVFFKFILVLVQVIWFYKVIF